MKLTNRFGLPAAIALLTTVAHAQPAATPQNLWVEAETLGPLVGANFSFQQEAATTKGSWSIAGPGVAAEWTQGGESGLLSVAARADEPAGTSVGRDIEIAAAGNYVLWTRYADYREKKEEFGVRITQGDQKFEHVFGSTLVVDELDPLKLRWDWAFGWDSAPVVLQKGAARIELFSTGPTESRRHVDALALTTDATYKPTGRDKPDAATWKILRAMTPNQTLAPAAVLSARPPKTSKPAFLWNVRDQWLGQLDKPDAERIEAPFAVDPPLLEGFSKMFVGKKPPVYASPLSGPVVYIPDYPKAFADGSQFMAWLDRNPGQKFAILLNYADPTWPEGTTDADKQKRHANLKKYGERFLGFIAGESISYAYPDMKALQAGVSAAKSRAEVMQLLSTAYTDATVAKFSGYFGEKLTPKQAWSPVVSCLSWGIESYAHLLGAWGVQRIGHENSGTSATMARRLAFLRGAARQFDTGLLDYQSINLGDSATMFSRESFFYPASSRYVFDNQYDLWAGAGVNWLLKDYLLWHLAGVDGFYNEQGIDFYWKPGGSAAGDDFPVQLSPKGKVAQAVQRVAESHPRGAQFTPVAFLLDQAHGWAQEEYQPGAFGLDPAWNPKVLALDARDASIQGWMDVAFFPAPETRNEPASGVRQTYVNGKFGDIFDVIVTAPGKTSIAKDYPVLIAAGHIVLTAEWGDALRAYIENGGTLVLSAGTFSGPGAAVLGLKSGEKGETSSFIWKDGNLAVPSNTFRYSALEAGANKVLAATPEGAPICLESKLGKGRVVVIGANLGIGINEEPTPLLALVMKHVTDGVLPIRVDGDVEWALNKLENGRWLVTILNNRGINKPQHGVLPTDYTQAQTVTIRSSAPVKTSREWITQNDTKWNGATTSITVPAGAVRMIEVGF